MSSLGLQHAIDAHITLDLKIDLQAPYVIVPYGGKYMENENVLVVNLGRVRIYSLDRPEKRDVRKMHSEGVSEKEILKQMIAQSYDQFRLELTNLQVLVAQSCEDWKACLKNGKMTEMHLLNPVNLTVMVSKCLIVDDPRLPHMKVSGELPSVNLTVSDARLLLLAALGSSIPLPQGDVPEPAPLGVRFFCCLIFFNVFVHVLGCQKDEFKYFYVEIFGVARKCEKNQRSLTKCEESRWQ